LNPRPPKYAVEMLTTQLLHLVHISSLFINDTVSAPDKWA